MMQKDELKSIAHTIMEQNLGVGASESLLFFTDFTSRWEDRLETLIERRRFLHRFYEAFEAAVADHHDARHDKYESSKRHGSEPGESIWRLAFGDNIYGSLLSRDLVWKLKAEQPLEEGEWALIRQLLDRFSGEVADCVVAFPWYSVTHTRFRRLLNEAGCRFISMPMCTESIMSGPMRADWALVAERTRSVFDILTATEELHLRCPAGTDLVIGVGGSETIHEDAGMFRARGTFGNLPAGEAYLVPREGSAEGVVVFTSGPELPEIEATPVLIEDGKVAECSLETEYAEILEKKFEADFHIRHVAELGIGTNPEARDVSSMIEGEKIQGTVHLALGDDSSIGGKNEATEHLDHIIVDCNLVARLAGGGERTIVANGELVV